MLRVQVKHKRSVTIASGFFRELGQCWRLLQILRLKLVSLVQEVIRWGFSCLWCRLTLFVHRLDPWRLILLQMASGYLSDILSVLELKRCAPLRVVRARFDGLPRRLL